MSHTRVDIQFEAEAEVVAGRRRLVSLAQDDARLERLERMLHDVNDGYHPQVHHRSLERHHDGERAKMGWDMYAMRPSKSATMMTSVAMQPTDVSMMRHHQQQPAMMTYMPRAPVEKPMMAMEVKKPVVMVPMMTKPALKRPTRRTST